MYNIQNQVIYNILLKIYKHFLSFLFTVNDGIINMPDIKQIIKAYNKDNVKLIIVSFIK